jgi:alpha-ketoglutarate-dependent taurine dioxygenase
VIVLGKANPRSTALVPCSDGLLSVVQEDYSSVDFNHHGRGYDFHTDGLYYDLVPDHVILYCVNVGTRSTLTTFADTRPAAQRIE